jgi:hypothetical protein
MGQAESTAEYQYLSAFEAQPNSMSRDDYAWQCFVEARSSFDREGGW